MEEQTQKNFYIDNIKQKSHFNNEVTFYFILDLNQLHLFQTICLKLQFDLHIVWHQACLFQPQEPLYFQHLYLDLIFYSIEFLISEFFFNINQKICVIYNIGKNKN